jgi:hypothetical protein
MFGREDELVLYLLGLGLGTAVLSGLLTGIAAWRYGRRRAIAVPILALAAIGLLMWRGAGRGSEHAMTLGVFAMIFAGPAVAGGLLGLALAGRRKG